ncbi:MAG TPA: hypothetical protein VMT35_18650 [Ignavibacteriaceae bacterium]|nr:hypothetical protein [Ignavibacteriaceae bacterium]
MKLRMIISLAFLFYCFLHGENNINITPSDSDETGLNLQAVGELFKDSENLEEFEKAINDSGKGINNLDLDNDGKVDYIKVTEDVKDNTHLIVLQDPVSKDESQDVATIEVEKSGEDYNMQIKGNEEIYGANYYVVPTVVHVRTWPIISFIYRPAYRPYRSAFYFGFYPRWWHPFHPIARHVYHARVVTVTHRRTFTIAKTTRVRSISKFHYKPHSSKLVVRKTTIKRNGKTVKRTRVKVR